MRALTAITVAAVVVLAQAPAAAADSAKLTMSFRTLPGTTGQKQARRAASASKLHYGDKAIISGRLVRSSDGTALAGRRITVEFCNADWDSCSAPVVTRTTKKGDYRAELTIQYGVYLREGMLKATYSGGGEVRSKRLKMYVRGDLTLKGKKGPGAKVTLSGRFKKFALGTGWTSGSYEPVVVYRSYDGKKWKALPGLNAVGDSLGRFKVVFGSRKSAYWRVAPAAKLIDATSPAVKVKGR